MNTFGQYFRMTSFGESHGPAMGVVIDGCPAGLKIDLGQISEMLERRRPGGSVLVSDRNEQDQFEILSGVFEGKTLGTPIAVVVKNTDQRSQDYDKIKSDPRIGHADDVWKNKFGHVDHRGGGRSSGRETVARVIAGAIAKQLVQQLYPQFSVNSKAKQIGPLKEEALTDANIRELLTEAKEKGLSYGGISTLRIQNPPPSLGQPVFKKIKAELASAVLSLGAVNGFQIGEGFNSTNIEGTDFHKSMDSQNYGGIRGGITTGEDIEFDVSFKPTSSVLDVARRGRHDPCVLLRAQVVLESMCYLVFADQILAARLDTI